MMSDPFSMNGRTLAWILFGGPILPLALLHSLLPTQPTHPYFWTERTSSGFRFKCSHFVTTIPAPGALGPFATVPAPAPAILGVIIPPPAPPGVVGPAPLPFPFPLGFIEVGHPPPGDMSFIFPGPRLGGPQVFSPSLPGAGGIILEEADRGTPGRC
jgi:hypothetical protein